MFLGLGSGYRQSGLGWSHLQDNYGGTYAHCQMLAGLYSCSERLSQKSCIVVIQRVSHQKWRHDYDIMMPDSIYGAQP